jgi:Putative Actinobacterial Holin-X, holin superfamily III
VSETPPAPESSPNRAAAAKEAAQQVRTGASSMGETLQELVSMVLAYAKQETVDPIKKLVRYLLWGVAGALCLSLGGFFLVLAVIRALQSEAAPHLSGDWSWVPYFAGLAVAVLGVVLAISRIGKTPKPRSDAV